MKGRFTVMAKPNSRESAITEYDEKLRLIKANLKSRPENNKANIELLKLLQKTYKKRFRIVSGLTSRTKVVEAVE